MIDKCVEGNLKYKSESIEYVYILFINPGFSTDKFDLLHSDQFHE